jgi:hypothetical protein
MFIRHTQCPNCQKQGNDKGKDNLAVYSDGEYCFSCHYTKKYKGEQKEDTKFDSLTYTFTMAIPQRYVDYLAKFHINPKHMYFQKYFKYCPELDRLSFCHSPDDSDRKVFYEFRSCNREPKVLSYGNKPWFLLPWGTIKDLPLVIVEDIFSTFRVYPVAKTLCLFGSSIPDESFQKIVKAKAKPILWLDRDKLGVARTYRDKFRAAGLESSLIFSRKDPKYYFEFEINEFVKKASSEFSTPKEPEPEKPELVWRYNPMETRMVQVPANSFRAMLWLEEKPDWCPALPHTEGVWRWNGPTPHWIPYGHHAYSSMSLSPAKVSTGFLHTYWNNLDIQAEINHESQLYLQNIKQIVP